MFNRTSPSHSVLLIDITSGSVGVGLAGVREKALPELLYTSRSDFGSLETVTEGSLEAALMRTLQQSLRDALMKGSVRLAKQGYPGSIDHAAVTFSSPWFVSSLGEREADFKADLFGRYGHAADVFENAGGLMSAGKSALLSRVEDEVVRAFGLKRGINMQTFPYIFSRVFTHAFQGADTAAFVDVTAHATDILSVDKGRIMHSLSLPFGHYDAKKDDAAEAERAWSALSTELRRELGPRASTVAYIATDDDALAAKALIISALPGSRATAIGPDNPFTKLVVRTHPLADESERLSLLASFSNIFL